MSNRFRIPVVRIYRVITDIFGLHRISAIFATMHNALKKCSANQFQFAELYDNRISMPAVASRVTK
jgi:hypothetical protein